MKKLLLILGLGLISVAGFSQNKKGAFNDGKAGPTPLNSGFSINGKVINGVDSKRTLTNKSNYIAPSSVIKAYIEDSYLTNDYEAILTQSGSVSPKDTAWNNAEAYNLLGGTKTWVRTGAGTYELRDSTANFTTKNTIVNITPQTVSVSDSSMHVINYAITNKYKITLTTYLQRYGYTKVRTLTDGILDRKRILVKVTK